MIDLVPRPPVRTPSRIPLVLLVGVLAAAACSRPAGPAGTRAPAASSRPAAVTSPRPIPGGAVVAEINGSPILASELDEKAAGQLTRVRQEEYEIRRQALDQLIADRLIAAEAAKRRLSTEVLVQREVDQKAAPVKDADVEQIYEQNRGRFGAAARKEAIARIRQVMGDRAKSDRRASWERELRAAANVSVRLEPPRTAVTIPPGAPSTGPSDARVTIVEFTDYQCPFCHRAQAVVDQVLRQYSGRIRFVHLDFPLDGHPQALPAARAARCAGEQGRFWEYHRDLMTAPGTLDAADLQRRAAALRLDTSSFERCVSSGRYDQVIQSSLREGEELGVSGTPAYFVNGRMISGAPRSIETFADPIEEELAASRG